MTYEEWETSVPQAIRDDSLWKMKAYRLGLFLSDLGWRDGSILLRDRRGASVADQLIRASGHISACAAEGYSRNSGKARATYYEYALGSTRETRDWYFKARHVLKAKVVEHRLNTCAELIKLLLKMANRERRTNRMIVSMPKPATLSARPG